MAVLGGRTSPLASTSQGTQARTAQLSCSPGPAPHVEMATWRTCGGWAAEFGELVAQQETTHLPSLPLAHHPWYWIYPVTDTDTRGFL